MRLLLRFLLLAMVCASGATAATPNNTWVGPATGSWSNAANWSNGVPSTNDDVGIPSGVTTTVDLGIGINSLTSAGTVIIGGQGTLAVTTSVTMTGQLRLAGGILAGTLTTGAGGSYVGTAAGGTLFGVTIDATTVFDLSQTNGASCTVANGLTVDGKVLLGSTDGARFADLFANSTQTLGGSGAIVFGASPSNQILLNANNITVTVSTSLAIHGKAGNINSSNTNVTLANQGLISADSADSAGGTSGAVGTITITANIGTLANTGVLNASNGGTLTINSAGWSSTGNGHVNAAGATVNFGGFFSAATAQAAVIGTGGIANLTGNLGNIGTTFTPANTGGTWFLAGGTLNGGTLATGGLVGTTAGGTLNAVTISAGTTVDLSQTNGATCAVTGGMTLNGKFLLGSTDGVRFADLFASATQTWGGSGAIIFGGSSSNQILLNANGVTLTVGPALTIHGKSGNINSSNTNIALANQGTISADSADSAGGTSGAVGTLTITSNIGTLTNTGVLNAANGGTLTINAVSWASTGGGQVSLAGATVNFGGTFGNATAQAVSIGAGGIANITGTLTNTGAVFIPANTGGTWSLAGGTLNGGTLGTGGLLGTTANGTLNAVIISAGATVDLSQTNGATCSVTGGMTLNGKILLGSTDGVRFADLFSNVTQTWDGTGAIVFGGSSSNQILLNANGVTLTVGSALTIHGKSGNINSSNTAVALANQGTISDDSADSASGTTGAVGILTITANIATLTNTGTLAAANGGTLTINAVSWASTSGGLVSVTGATVNFGGTFGNATAQAVSIGAGGIANLTGTLTNTGAVFTPATTGGAWSLAGGTLNGGTLGNGGLLGTTASGTLNAVTISAGTTVDLSQTNGATCAVTGGVTLNGKLLLGSTDGVRFADLFASGTQTWGGTGAIVFGGSSSNQILLNVNNTTLTVGGALTIHGKSGNINSSNTGVAFINQGTISADSADSASGTTGAVGTLVITANIVTLTNTGTLAAANGGTLTINAASWTSAGSGLVSVAGATVNFGGAFATPTAQAVSIGAGGIANLTGTLTNSGSTFTPANTGGAWHLVGGTVNNGTIGTGVLIASSASGTLTGVHVSAGTTVDLSQVNGATCSVRGGMVLDGKILIGSTDGARFADLFSEVTQTWDSSSSGSIVFGGSSSNQILLNASNGTLTIGSGLTIHGKSGLINTNVSGVTVVNQGTISADGADSAGGTSGAVGTLQITANIATLTNTGSLAAANGGTLTINPASWASTGSGLVSVTGATVNFGGHFANPTAQAATIGAGGIANLTGTLSNGGASFSPAATGASWFLAGGTLTGGHLAGAGGLIGTTAQGTLNGVIIDAGTSVDLTQVNGAACVITGGMTLNGTITVGSADGARFADLISNVTQTWSGSGDILLGGSSSNGILLNVSNVTLTIGSNLTVHGKSIRMGAGNTGTAIINQGTIATDVAGGSAAIAVQTFTNAGTLTLGQGFAQTWNCTTDFIQTSVGTMNIEIGGASSFDILAITGTANLAGTLNLTTINGFVPSTGQTFGFLTSSIARAGTFSPVTGNFTLNGPTSTVLNAVAGATTIPSVVVTTARSTTHLSPITYTLTFSEAVAGLTTAGLTVTNGTAGTLSGGPTVYTVPITPTAQGTVGLLVKANAAHNAGSAGNTASGTVNVTFDTVAPTVAIAPSGTTTALSPIPFTLTFSEAVTGLNSSSLAVTNGTVGTVTGSGANYTVAVTPTAAGAVTVQLRAGIVADAADNTNALSAVDTVTFDPSAVTVDVSPASGATNSSVISFTLTFSQPVTGMVTGGLAITNGTPSNLSGSGDTFTVDVTPTAQGVVTLQVKAGATTSSSSAVPNQVSNLASLTFDSVDPGVTISPDGTTATSSPITFTMTFTEAVTGFSSGDISVSNGTVLAIAGGPAVYTFTVAPSASGPVTAHLGSDAAHDAAGNLNTDSNLATVTFAPATPAATVVVTALSPLLKAGPIPFAVVFSAPVTGFGLDDLTVGNATAISLTGSGTSYTVGVTPTADGPVTLAVVAGAALDGSDVATLASNVASCTFDSTRPRVRLALAGALPVTTSITLEVTFSEPVTGFNSTLIATTNATQSAFTAIDAATYSVVLTPTSASASMAASIATDVCRDVAGNLNLGATLTVPVESSLVSTTVTTPPVPLSSGNRVVYTALGPGTSAGLEQVRAFLAGKSNSQARGFIWDAAAQSYVQVPTTGWQPFDGVFLATREAPAFDFNGHTSTLDFTLTLRPGYNFICIPPLDDGGTVLVDHAFADLAVEDTAGAVIGGSTRDALVGTGVFAWDGTTYSQVDTLHTGTGYWIENASSPPVDLVLRRVSQQSLSAVATLAVARSIGARPRTAPPAPPGGAASGSSSGGGKACGLGSGIASLALVFAALFLRLRLRSPRRC